jgi:3alpha(or 20beta)-hydroxysteroid dehydrogenase
LNVLKDKVAIITGGAKGQGAAEAQLFLKEGAAVVITDIDERKGQALAETLGDRALFIRHDIGSHTEWMQVVDLALARFGGIDILVNNAAVWGATTLENIKEAEFRRYFEINVFGSFLGMQAVIEPMTKRGGGSIVNIASAGALRGYAGVFGYGVSKWAMRGLSRYAAHDLVKMNIRVNSILSGMIQTDMIDTQDASALVERAKMMVPMGRLGQPAEMATIALFLASSASSYMTGAELVADGGVNA